ncbi:MAG: hypothetical protein ACLQLH_03015 [Terracidiphilus sp.]|jgi:hypothetical protein
MRKVSIKGVIIGGIVDMVSSMVLGIPFAFYAYSTLDLAHMPQDAGSAVRAAMEANIPLYIFQLFVGMCCSALGGFVAAWLAKHDELLNGALSAFLSMISGIYAMSAGKDTHSIYIQILLIISCPVFGLLGGYLRLMQKRARIQQPQQQRRSNCLPSSQQQHEHEER